MPLFRVTFEMRSATATPWQADTIFGHLCWAIRRREGEAALTEFLELYGVGLAPLVVSDGFPGDLLPRPLIPAGGRGEGLRERREQARIAKQGRRESYLTAAEFAAALRGEPVAPSPKGVPGERVTLKNQINRATNTILQRKDGDGAGHLYEIEETFWERVAIYVRTDGLDADWARRLFEDVAATGYGKRKSVGYGAVERLTWEPFIDFPAPPEANGFVTLSGFVPAQRDPTRGFWRTRVKYGRLGEELAVAGNPFKRPLLMLATGSCFYDTPVRPVYGRLVPGVSAAHPEVVQYGLAFAVPARLPAL